MGHIGHVYVNHGSVTHGSHWSLMGYMRVKYGSYGSHVGQPWDIFGHMVHVGVTQGSYIGHMGHIWVMMWGSPMGHIGFLWVIRVNNGSRICHKWVNNGSYMGQNHRPMSHMSYMNQP